MAGAVAGRREDVDLEARKRKLLPSRQRVVGLVALERSEPGRHPAHDVGEHAALDLGAVDGRSRGPGDGSDGANVVEVGVRDEDRLDRHAEGSGDREQALRLVAGVDDQGAG